MYYWTRTHCCIWCRTGISAKRPSPATLPSATWRALLPEIQHNFDNGDDDDGNIDVDNDDDKGKYEWQGCSHGWNPLGRMWVQRCEFNNPTFHAIGRILLIIMILHDHCYHNFDHLDHHTHSHCHQHLIIIQMIQFETSLRCWIVTWRLRLQKHRNNSHIQTCILWE